MNIALLIVWILVGTVHIGIPLAYFASMKRLANRSSDYHIKFDNGQQPTVSILIPTYNEVSVIEEKLGNISNISYPKNKLEIIVVDGGSVDGTPALARRVMNEHGLKGEVMEEGERKGKAAGLNSALAVATGELVCISDAECQWDQRALENATRYLSDPTVGSVSGVHQIRNPRETLSTQAEDSYRSLYRMLRVAESKIQSTPVAEGELQLFRRKDLPGFDPTVGGDDTDAALTMVAKGLRAISAQDVVFFEPTPLGWRSRFRQKIRRGQHVMQAFLKHRNLLFTDRTPFSRLIFPMEFFLYVINPIFFAPFLLLTVLLLVVLPLVSIFFAVAVIVALAIPTLRQTGITYVTNNLIMLAAIFQELRGDKQLQWAKIEDTRGLNQSGRSGNG